MIGALGILQFNLGQTTDVILCGAIASCLIALCFRPFSRLVVLVLVAIFTLTILEDQLRLQPWLYLYLIILLAVSISGKNRQEHALVLLRFILAGTYFWSGLQKLNHSFATDVFPWLMHPFGLQNFVMEHHRLAYSIPLLELCAGVGLLFQRAQRTSGLILVIIHGIIICALGPWANNWNSVIWPWNIAMVVILLVVIFSEYKGFSSLRSAVSGKWAVVAILLTCIMPAFNFIGYWDNYLSDSLYSGTVPEGIFYYPKDNGPVPENLKPQARDDGYYYVLDDWALRELHAPIYPEERYFKRVAKQLCKGQKDKTIAGLLIVRKQKFTATVQQEVCNCDSLLKTP
jgi:uncharacterized membrane protein YphA (DoxX/SURF4 family)